MFGKKHLLKVGLLFLIIFFSSWMLFAQGKEELLFMEIPEVFASSKRLQPITESASTIEIITNEDIKLSGATNLGDVLRSVAGIDVRESDVAQHVIGVRGFCDTGHLLVTLDGNNVFMYHANHIFLDWAPVDLEEIDHIEIIKGPGAIFYGGNAFSGVINIITKTPQQLKGTQVNLVGGDWESARTNLIHADIYKNFSFILSGGYRQSLEWENAEPILGQENIEGEKFKVGYLAGKAIYNFTEQSNLSFMGRFSDAGNVISKVCQPKTTFAALRYDNPDFWLRFFYNNHEKTFWNDTFGVKDANYEFEIFRSFKWRKGIISLGGFAKQTAWEVETLKDTDGGPEIGNLEKHKVRDFALNIENEFHLNDKFILFLGARGEYYTHLDYIGLGRGSFIYKPAANQSLRLTVASGYYIPSLFQHTNEGTAYPFAVGNYDLKEEKISSYELNYYGQLSEKLKLNAAIFYNNYRNLIDNTQSGPMQNVADANQKGGELGLKFLFCEQLSGFANYAYQTIQRDDFGDLSVDPENKINIGFTAKLGKYTVSSTFHYVDRYYEIYLTSNPVFGLIQDWTTGEAIPQKIDSYTTTNARVSYAPTDKIELAIAGYNIFNDRHYESNPPSELDGNWHNGDLIGRKISASISFKF